MHLDYYYKRRIILCKNVLAWPFRSHRAVRIASGLDTNIIINIKPSSLTLLYNYYISLDIMVMRTSTKVLF